MKDDVCKDCLKEDKENCTLCEDIKELDSLNPSDAATAIRDAIPTPEYIRDLILSVASVHEISLEAAENWVLGDKYKVSTLRRLGIKAHGEEFEGE